MKKLAILAAVLLTIVASCGGLKKSYGPVKVDETKAMSVSEMLSDYGDRTDSVEYTFKAPLQAVCVKAGCWVNVDKGNGETFMVRFKDHFCIPPTTPAGTEAIINGLAFNDTISVKQLRHYAKDAGKSKEEIEKITEPKISFGFEGHGIRILK